MQDTVYFLCVFTSLNDSVFMFVFLLMWGFLLLQVLLELRGLFLK